VSISKKKENILRVTYYTNSPPPIMAIPIINPITRAIIIQIIMATIAIASAINHPVSKKCFTNASQTNSTMIAAIIPAKRYWKIPPITIPRTTIHIASVNFALSLPASSLPAIYRTGDRIMMLMIKFITNVSKLSAMQFHFLFCTLYSQAILF